MQLDTVTGLYYDNARWYDAMNSIFVSQDPIGFNDGGTNLAMYCGNSPTNATDPTGEFFSLVTGFIGAAASAGTYYVIAHANGSYTPGGLASAAINGFAVGGAIGAVTTGDPTALLIAGTIGGAAGGFLGSIAQQLIDRPSQLPDPGKVALSTASGALFGALSSAIPLPPGSGLNFGLNVAVSRGAGGTTVNILTHAELNLLRNVTIGGAVGVRISYSSSGSGGGSPVRGGKTVDGGELINDPKTPAPAPSAKRPTPKTSLPDRVTKELPPGEIRTPEETAQARSFFERNRKSAEKWYEQRTGTDYPDNASNAGHNPRAIGDGGDPLLIEPEFDGPNAKHMIPGEDGLTDAQRWALRGWAIRRGQLPSQ
jgi:RHS repeat-associated protein